MKPQRTKKVASAIKRELASALLLQSGNPLFQQISITNVEVTADLGTAFVYYYFTPDLHADIDRETLQAQLDRAAPYLAHLIQGRVDLRRFPELRFRFDQGIEQQERIESILKQIKSE